MLEKWRNFSSPVLISLTNFDLVLILTNRKSEQFILCFIYLFTYASAFVWFLFHLIAVSVQCVNMCKLTKGEGSGRYDCSVLSCAWKAPRVLTGFLASTANPSHSSSFAYTRYGSRNRIKSVSLFFFFPLCLC